MIKWILIGIVIFLIIDFIIGLTVYFVMDAKDPGATEVPKEEKKSKKKGSLSEGTIKTVAYLGLMPMSFFYSVYKLGMERKRAKRDRRHNNRYI